MKRSPRRIALQVLQQWEKGSTYAADLIEAEVSQYRLRPIDRPLVQQLIYTTIRNQTLLDHFARLLTDGKLDPKTRRILRLGLAELVLMDGTPHAVVNETVSLASKWAKGVVNAVLRRAIDEKENLLVAVPTLEPSIRWSLPSFLWDRWIDQFGLEDTSKLAAWNQIPSPVYLRINPLHERPIQSCDGVSEVAGHPAYRKVNGDLPKDALNEGLVYAQDPSTALAISLLAPKPGETILDACAAPGGKTLAIASAMHNQGQIIATDNSPNRVERLRINLKRLSVSNTVCQLKNWQVEDSEAEALPEFDRILVDVPCSNTGVIRRRIDVKWRIKPRDFAKLQETQLQLLHAVSKRLKPGGSLVYSTCSLETDENEAVVEKFLEQNPEFSLREQQRSLPWRDGFDGAFAAKIERIG